MMEQEPVESAKVEAKIPQNRIHGFGNGPPPPPLPETPTDYLWDAFASASESLSAPDIQDTFSSWYSSALEQFDAVVDALDETVDNIADALEEAVGGQQDASPAQRGSFQPVGSPDAVPRVLVASAGEMSDTDWPAEISGIYSGGNIEEFVAKIKARSKSDEEQCFVGDTMAEQFLNEVDHEALQRILIIFLVVIQRGLKLCARRLEARCSVKLRKMKNVALCARTAEDVLAALDQMEAEAESSAAAKSAPPAAAPEVDLIDLGDGDASSQSHSGGGVSGSVGQALSEGDQITAVWPGDGRVYPAFVERADADSILVNWRRPAGIRSAGDRFVGDVGDDSTHRKIARRDVVEVLPTDQDLLDLGTPTSQNQGLQSQIRGNESLVGFEAARPLFGGLLGDAPEPSGTGAKLLVG